MEDSGDYDYGDGSDYGGSDDGMGGYDYGVAGGSSPIAHLRKVKLIPAKLLSWSMLSC